jgi:hypothetical protein
MLAHHHAHELSLVGATSAKASQARRLYPPGGFLFRRRGGDDLFRFDVDAGERIVSGILHVLCFVVLFSNLC